MRDFFVERLERLNRAGVDAVRVVLDPGIGFGKTLEHNLKLLAGLERFTNLNRPVLVGVSRKSFIGRLLGMEVSERLAAAITLGDAPYRLPITASVSPLSTLCTRQEALRSAGTVSNAATNETPVPRGTFKW